MNTTKHTPGPWRVDHNRCLIHGPTELVARLAYTQQGTVQNGNLIAAAPVMYIELKEGLVLLEASHHDMVDMYGIDSLQAKTVWERIESTRNVIAQAEGR